MRLLTLKTGIDQVFIFTRPSSWFGRPSTTDAAITQIDVAGDFSLPSQFTLAGHEGLIAVEVIRADERSRLLALWRDRTARDLRQGDLAKAVGGTIAWSGDVLEVRKPRQGAPASFADALLKVSAFIGAVTVVVTVLSSWFAWPNVVFAVPEQQPVDAGVGERFAFSVAALNNDRSNAAEVRLRVRQTPSGTVNLSTPVLVVPPGGREVASVTGTTSQAGESVVEIVASTRAGRLIPARDDTIRTTVHAWRPIDTAALERQHRQGASPRSMTFQGAIATGDPLAASLNCESVLANAPRTLRFVSVVPSTDGGGKPDESRGADARTIAIRWTAPVVRRFAWFPVTLHLENEGPVTNLPDQNVRPTLECEVVR